MDDKRKYDLLYASFDRKLTVGERALLNDRLAADPILRKEKLEIEKIRNRMKGTSFHFKAGFAERVLSKIKDTVPVIEMDFSIQLVSLFKKIALTGVAAIIILLITIYLTAGSLNKETVVGVDTSSDDNLVSYLLYEDMAE